MMKVGASDCGNPKDARDPHRFSSAIIKKPHSARTGRHSLHNPLAFYVIFRRQRQIENLRRAPEKRAEINVEVKVFHKTLELMRCKTYRSRLNGMVILVEVC